MQLIDLDVNHAYLIPSKFLNLSVYIKFTFTLSVTSVLHLDEYNDYLLRNHVVSNELMESSSWFDFHLYFNVFRGSSIDFSEFNFVMKTTC